MRIDEVEVLRTETKSSVRLGEAHRLCRSTSTSSFVRLGKARQFCCLCKAHRVAAWVAGHTLIVCSTAELALCEPGVL
jgi:hypothetical protein